MTDQTNNAEAPTQLRREILNIIRRYGQESDVTVYQALGALEVVKADLIDMLDRAKEGL